MTQHAQTAPDMPMTLGATGSSPKSAGEVCRLRDEILGPIRPGENLEEFRLRSYQALATARELIQAEVGPPEISEEWSDDPTLQESYRHLAEINQAIHQPL